VTPYHLETDADPRLGASDATGHVQSNLVRPYSRSYEIARESSSYTLRPRQ